MKKLFFGVIATVLFTVSGFANNIVDEDIKNTNVKVESIFIEDKCISSCTITTVTQIVSNGELTYQSSVLLHVDGVDCNEFFNGIMQAVWSAVRR